ncbi:MAG TPA: hypothetical protein VFZ97_12465 [Acidimicrobiales bacterium]
MDEIRTSLQVDETASLHQGMTKEEDAELRRLHWMSRVGMLSVAKRERMIELRLRDRRTAVREPKEFGEQEPALPAKSRGKWYKFRVR